MKLKDIMEKAKAENATKVFINPVDADRFFSFPAFPVEISHLIDLPAIGRGNCLNWYEDASLQPGTFRVAS